MLDVVMVDGQAKGIITEIWLTEASSLMRRMLLCLRQVVIPMSSISPQMQWAAMSQQLGVPQSAGLCLPILATHKSTPPASLSQVNISLS